MVKKNKKKAKKGKTLSRVVTLVLGLGFAGSTLAIALSSVFSQNNYSASNSDSSEEAPSVEEQIQLQAKGYEKVLEREPENFTALDGLTQIYLQTGQPEKAIPTLEKLVELYPEQQEYAGILQIIQQQQNSKVQESETIPEATAETK
ncbi:MAG: tetratricopeptide repeat protein [Cyanobacteria bacterium P01_A01_bin.40]